MFSFEKALVCHCSPTLCGLKPANLLSLSKKEYPQLPQLIEDYRHLLAGKGINLQILCECGCRWLLLVFRPQMLAQQLTNPEIRSLLAEEGYPSNENNLAATLLYLSQKLSSAAEFPHEIGIFLGYPLADVLGFRQYKGERCKLCGYWKVYGDVESALRCFAAFDRCRDSLVSRLMTGQPLSELVVETNAA